MDCLNYVNGMSEDEETMRKEQLGTNFVNLGFSCEASTKLLRAHQPEARYVCSNQICFVSKKIAQTLFLFASRLVELGFQLRLILRLLFRPITNFEVATSIQTILPNKSGKAKIIPIKIAR